MATLLEHAASLAKAFPDGGPVYLKAMARIFWPDADWLDTKMCRHNGGARRGARVAGALAGKLERAGYLWMAPSDGPRCYKIKVDAIAKALEAAKTQPEPQ